MTSAEAVFIGKACIGLLASLFGLGYWKRKRDQAIKRQQQQLRDFIIGAQDRHNIIEFPGEGTND